MRINNVSFSIEPTASIQPLKIKTSGYASIPKYDNAYISPVGQDMSLVKKVLKDTPDIREDKVNEIKAKIKDGTYHISTDDLANKLLGLE